MLDVRSHFIVCHCHVYVISLSCWFGKCNKHANKNYHHLGNAKICKQKLLPIWEMHKQCKQKKQRKTNATKKTMKKTCKQSCKDNVNKMTRVLAQNDVFRLPSSAPGPATRAG